MDRVKSLLKRAVQVWVQYGPAVDRGLGTISRVCFHILILLLGIWLLGRVFEALFSNTVFDPQLIRWLGLSAWILVCIGVTAYGLQSAKVMASPSGRFTGMAIWLVCLCILGFAVFSSSGYGEAIAGLLAHLEGAVQRAELSVFQMFKQHPFSPLLPINVATLHLAGGIANAHQIQPFLWNLSWIIGIFIASALFGVLMMFAAPFREIKFTQVILALFGAVAAMLVRGKGLNQPDIRIWLHAYAMGVISFQFLIGYASLRRASAKVLDSAHLPPKAVTVVLLLFLVLPVAADLHRQYRMAAFSPTPTQRAFPGGSEPAATGSAGSAKATSEAPDLQMLSKGGIS